MRARCHRAMVIVKSLSVSLRDHPPKSEGLHYRTTPWCSIAAVGNLRLVDRGCEWATQVVVGSWAHGASQFRMHACEVPEAGTGTYGENGAWAAVCPRLQEREETVK